MVSSAPAAPPASPPTVNPAPRLAIGRRGAAKGAAAAAGATLAYVAPAATRIGFAQQVGSPPPTGGGNGTLPPPQPCDVETSAGGQGVTTNVHNLGQTSGSFGFQYEAFGQADRFDIYLGAGTAGALLFTTGGFVSGGATVTVAFSGASQITVVVTGPEAGTLWNYTVRCPNGTTISASSAG